MAGLLSLDDPFLVLQREFPDDITWAISRDLDDSYCDSIRVRAARDDVSVSASFIEGISLYRQEGGIPRAVWDAMRAAYGQLLVHENSMRKRGKWIKWHVRTSRVSKQTWPRLIQVWNP